MDAARGPYVSMMAAAATAVATAGIAWYFLRRRDPDEALLQALVLREAVDRERSLRLGPLSAVHVIPRAEGRSSSAGVAAAQIGEDASARPITVFFVHGMWHGAWYFRALQKLLADQGVGSYAVTLNAGLTVGLDQHVKDVAVALASLPKDTRLVLVGHSQGGLIVQDLLHTVPGARLPPVCGTVLLGTGALGQKDLVDLTASSVRSAVVSSSGWLPYLRMVFTMSPPPGDVVALQAMFAHFETSEVTVTGKAISMQNYLRLLRARPADGWPTYVSNVAKWGAKEVPKTLGSAQRLLVVQFEDDQCYPEPHTKWLLTQYAGAELLRVPKQAHCAVDDGWEETLGKPLVQWIKGCEASPSSR